MPVCVPELLGKVKQWAGTARKVIVIGFSRGGAWGLDLVLNHAADLDAAALIAAYPHTKNTEVNFEESRQLMRVNRPILLIHYTGDFWVSPENYPGWFAGFHMHETRVTQTFQPGFSSIGVPGEHDLGLQLQLNLDFGTLDSPEAAHWWSCICSAGGR
jgi:dienelactone hydrolase